MGNCAIFLTFENPRRGRQARDFTTNVPKILDLKSSSEQIFSENCRWVPLNKGSWTEISLCAIYLWRKWWSNSFTAARTCTRQTSGEKLRRLLHKKREVRAFVWKGIRQNTPVSSKIYCYVKCANSRLKRYKGKNVSLFKKGGVTRKGVFIVQVRIQRQELQWSMEIDR